MVVFVGVDVVVAVVVVVVAAAAAVVVVVIGSESCIDYQVLLYIVCFFDQMFANKFLASQPDSTQGSNQSHETECNDIDFTQATFQVTIKTKSLSGLLGKQTAIFNIYSLTFFYHLRTLLWRDSFYHATNQSITSSGWRNRFSLLERQWER